MKTQQGLTIGLQAVVIALCLLASFPSAVAQSSWPIKDFEVFLGSPTASSFSMGGVSVEDVIRLGDDYVEMDISDPPATPIDPAVIEELESYLREAAAEFERLGFRPPVLEPVVEREDGSKAYRVYVYDFPDNRFARYRFECNDHVRPTILINARAYMPDGRKIIDKGYQDFPHELFHAIQRAYDLFADNCHLGDWISEGTAQAVGADIAAWSSRRKSFPNRNDLRWVIDRWGPRDYDKSLWIPDDEDPDTANAPYVDGNAAYGASSFWRYLGEWAATGGTAGIRIVPPDYRYLAEFFRHPVSPSGTREAAEIEWLDQRLRSYASFNRGLSSLYPGFVTTFAHYVPARFKPSGQDMRESTDKWLARLFPGEKCPEIRISEASPLYRENFAIKKYAAACYQLNLGFWQPVDLHIEVSGVSAGAVHATFLGTEQGKVVTPLIKKKQINAQWTGSRVLQFDDPMSSPAPKIVLTNIADDTRDTEDLAGELEISVSTFDHSMLPPEAKRQPAAPGEDRATGTSPANPTLEEQTRRASDHLDREISGLNRNLANSGSVAPNPRANPCDDAFLVKVCGPVTTIQLSAMPPILGSFDKAYGRGGEFAQFMSAVSGMASGGPLNASQQYRETLERVGKLDGVEVNITIPLIDYGFTGEFDNASLRVSKGGGGNYVALGPDIEPGPGVAYPLAGSVVIEEYTPTILRGTFRGSLVDPDDLVGLGDGDGLPVHDQISGSFHIAGTWRDDPRIEAILPDNLAESVRQDVLGLTEIPTGDVVPPTEVTASGSHAGGGSSRSVGVGACSCSCNILRQPTSPCHDQCGGTVRACQGSTATLEMLDAGKYQPLAVAATAADPFLRTLPDVCDLTDARLLAASLSVEEMIERGPREWIPEALSQCSYNARDNRRVTTRLELMFKPLDLYGSREKPAEELKDGVFGFSLLTASATEILDAPGNMAFVLHNDSDASSTLIVLTGIYGFGWQSESYANELVLTYSLTHTELSAKQRVDALLALAGPHVAKLQELAVTSHEGI